MIVPRRLRSGDTIGIVSPSSKISRYGRRYLRQGIVYLQSLGFNVVLGKNALKECDYSAGTPEERAQDINTMFVDPNIRAIICSQGGNTAKPLLPLLDWDAIKEHPKIFMGFSNITVLLNAIYAKTELITFHGDGVIKLGHDAKAYDRREFADRLIRGKIGKIKQNGTRKCVRTGTAAGRLIGGNLPSFMRLLGTQYLPDLTNSILFMEARVIEPGQCDSSFTQMKQAGIFEKVSGVIIGYIHTLQSRKKLPQMEEILLRVTSDYDFPILKVNDFGHERPNTVLPLGVKTRLDAENKEFEIIQRCVR
ncbi:MAG: LD-carboxypeptidase [Thaumarchaeota archaeon]|nr:LD-carboxypeptidase [Nitrososphaerota archaeon]